MTYLNGPIADSIRYKTTFVASIDNRVNDTSFGYEWISECLCVRIGWDIALLSSVPLFKLPKTKRRFTPPFPLFFFYLHTTIFFKQAGSVYRIFIMTLRIYFSGIILSLQLCILHLCCRYELFNLLVSCFYS